MLIDRPRQGLQRIPAWGVRNIIFPSFPLAEERDAERSDGRVSRRRCLAMTVMSRGDYSPRLRFAGRPSLRLRRKEGNCSYFNVSNTQGYRPGAQGDESVWSARGGPPARPDFQKQYRRNWLSTVYVNWPIFNILIISNLQRQKSSKQLIISLFHHISVCFIV